MTDTEHNYNKSMNNTFQLNKVYSNAAFYAAEANIALFLARFQLSLYKDEPERCPWPKARKYAQEIINEVKEVFTYFVPVRRTKHYLCFAKNGENKVRYKIRKDSEGNEFVLIDGMSLNATDLLNITTNEAKETYDNIFNELGNKMQFLEKLIEIEEYNYTYILVPSYSSDGTLLSNCTRIATEKELRDFYLLND